MCNGRRRLVTLAALLASSVAAGADPVNGQAMYRLWCFDCHTATGGSFGMLPVGYSVLSKRYGDTRPGDLAQRTDLDPVYIRVIVRQGLNVMPRTRLTEISERELEDVIAYLNRNQPLPMVQQ